MTPLVKVIKRKSFSRYMKVVRQEANKIPVRVQHVKHDAVQRFFKEVKLYGP